MKIVTTYREILDRGYWDEFCEMKGLNPYCINEGLVSSDQEVILTLQEAIDLNLTDEKTPT